MSTKLTINGVEVNALPPDVGQRVALDDETKAAISGFLDKHKSDPEYLNFIKGEDKQRLDAMMDEDLSPSARKLARYKAQQGPLVQSVEIDGEVWHLRQLNWADMTKLAILSARNGSAQINPTDSGDLKGLAAATLHCCVCTDEKGTDNFFTLSEAHDWIAEPSAKKVVEELFNKALELNPDILPSGEDEKKS